MHTAHAAALPVHSSALAPAARRRDLRSSESALTEWAGAHPLDDPELVPPLRETRRLEVHRLNARAGKRIAYVCPREEQLRTPSTAQLRYEADEAARLAARHPTPHVRALLAARRARLAARLAECARTRRARLGTADFLPSDPETPGTETPALAHVADAPPTHRPPAGTFRRRDHAHASPTAERLTRALTIAPGAPSREVTAQS